MFLPRLGKILGQLTGQAGEEKPEEHVVSEGFGETVLCTDGVAYVSTGAFFSLELGKDDYSEVCRDCAEHLAREGLTCGMYLVLRTTSFRCVGCERNIVVGEW